MLNFAGQDIHKGDYVGQVGRTSQGMKRRIGVVMGTVDITQTGVTTTGLRIIWNEFDGETWTLEDGAVKPDNVFVIDPHRMSNTVFLELDAARQRGHA
jgi:hypothetical protein